MFLKSLRLVLRQQDECHSQCQWRPNWKHLAKVLQTFCLDMICIQCIYITQLKLQDIRSNEKDKNISTQLLLCNVIVQAAFFHPDFMWFCLLRQEFFRLGQAMYWAHFSLALTGALVVMTPYFEPHTLVQILIIFAFLQRLILDPSSSSRLSQWHQRVTHVGAYPRPVDVHFFLSCPNSQRHKSCSKSLQ